MTTYIYGIVISVIMIAAGLSGQFSGGGSGINIPLVAVGAIFLIIDIMMVLQARKGEQQTPQVSKVEPANADAEQIEVNVEVPDSHQPQEAAETTLGTLMENPAGLSIEETLEAPIENPAEPLAEDAVEVPIENSVEQLAEEPAEAMTEETK